MRRRRRRKRKNEPRTGVQAARPARNKEESNEEREEIEPDSRSEENAGRDTEGRTDGQRMYRMFTRSITRNGVDIPSE